MSSSAQLMRQAETAKAVLTDPSKVLSDLWGQRQKLEDLYKQLLLHDLEYALDKKVEQDLWNHAFKNQISTLQNQAKDKVSLKKMEARANLNLFLEMASGFYLQFLQMICSTFKLDLPFRRRSSVFGITNENRIHDTNIVLPKKTSCLYICCHCLVHLGDIARYLQQTEQAQNYYRHAATLSPNNGQPYNQLAILEASRGDRLSTVFYYIRSLAVRHPFTVAATNLEKLYAKLIKDARDFDNPNLSVSEITVAFLHFQALLHSATNLDRASGLRNNIASSLASHIKSQTLTAAHLKGIVAISIFALHRARNDTSVPGEPVKKAMLSEEEQRCVQLHISFFAKLLETLLQHTPKEDGKVKDFLTLPTIKVCFDWLSLNRDVLKLREFNNTSLWQDMCKLLNNIQWLLNDNSKVPDPEKYVEMPLPEDMDLRCFQPLDATYGLFNYARAEKEEMSAGCERDLRCHRLVAHGKWIAHDLPTLKLIVFQSERSIRTQFSSQKIASQIEGLQATPAKSSRQNVAMQTILKKQMEKKAEEDKNTTIATPDGKAKAGNVARADASNASGASAGNGGRSGVIPVQHHKGGTFKANLPPRLSAKTKSQPSVSPRLQKKDDNNSNNFFTSLPSSSAMASKTITTTASMNKQQQQPQPPPPPPPVLDSEVEYPSLSSGGGGRKPVSLGVAASPLILPVQSAIGSNGSNVIANSNAASSSSSGGSVSKYTWGPALSTVVGGSPANAMEHDPAKGARGVVSSGGIVVGVENLPPTSSFGAPAFSGLYSTSQPPHHAHQSNSPRLSSPYSNNSAMEGITSSSSINSNRPKGSHLQEDSISKIGPQTLNSSSSSSGNPIPGYAAFSMQGPTSMQQPHQPQSLFQSSTANSNNGSLAHPHLQQQQQQQQMKLNNLFKQQQQQQFPRYPMSQVMSSTDYYSTAPPSQQQQQHAGLKMYEPKQQQQQQQQQQQLIFANSVAAAPVSPTSLHHQDQNPGDLGLFSTPGMAGTLQPSSYNPHSYQNQKQRQQQQQQLDNQDPNDSSKALSGLLYKNIPMPGSASRMTTSQHQSPQQQQQRQQPNPALAQLMALNRAGGSSTSTLSSSPSSSSPMSSQSDFFRSTGAGYRALTKPDLMGLQPPPSFLEQHHQDRSYNKMSGGHSHQHHHPPPPHHHQQHHQHPHHHHHNQQQQQHHHQQQQPSFLNTVMDPSFLQATGEYSLFNNNNNNNNIAGGGGAGSGSGNTSGNTGAGWPPVSVSAKPSHGSVPSGVRGPAPSTPSAFSVQGELNPSLQALWQNTGPSPLERLLEQQRHQRHNDG